MKAKDLTPLQRIEILEDVLRKLESGDARGGLCLKIENSAYELLRVWDEAKKITPFLTLENAKRVTNVKDNAGEGTHWWQRYCDYDFENRIEFVKWMIIEELTLATSMEELTV